jgi:hypothetical protein
VTTGTGESELALDNLGSGGSQFISGSNERVGATAINSTATLGVATVSVLARTNFVPPATAVFSLPGDTPVGSIGNIAPVAYAMDPADPNRAFGVSSTGIVYSLTLGPGTPTSSVLVNLNTQANTNYTCQSIVAAPNGADVVVGCTDQIDFPVVDLVLNDVSTSSHAVTSWANEFRGSVLGDLAMAPRGTAVYGTAISQQGAGSELFGLPFPFSSTSSFALNPVGTSPVQSATAVTVSRDGGTVYVGGGAGPNAASEVDAFNRSGTLTVSAAVQLVANANGAGGLSGLGLTPDGTQLLAFGQNTNAAGAVSNLIYVLSSSGLGTLSRSAPLGSGTPIGPQDIAVTPDQAPLANLTPASGSAGTPMTVNASASSVAYGSITNYAWNFGDGSPIVNSGGPTVTHSFATQGTYKVTVTETDSAGTSVPPAPFVSTAVNGPGTTPYLNASVTATVFEMVPVSKHGTPPPPPPPPPTTTTTVKRGTATTTTLPGTPVITLTPTVGSPGTIVTVTGTRFPRNHSVTVSWSTNTGSYTETTDAHGNLPAHEIFVLIPDVLGPRFATATSGGSTPVAKAPFLVVQGDGEPGGNSASVFFRSESE